MSFASMEVTNLGRGRSLRVTPVAIRPVSDPLPAHRWAPDPPPVLADWTDRLSGDAAAELRTPLAGIAEAIRAVASGELGPISPLQQDCLADATAACQRIDQMITGLRRLDQQRSGRPGVIRSWFDLEALRQEVDRGLAQSLPHRHALITWHGVQAGQYRVFADPAQLCLLLVGLLSSAIQRTPRGHHLLVRAIQEPGNQRVRLVVVDDCAAGHIDAPANSAAPSGPRLAESTSLLANCQHLAAALLTDLSIHHRAGRGREISFELPAAGLRSVAILWAQWRVRHTGKWRRQNNSDSLNPPALRATAPLHADQATVLTVRAGAAVSPDTVEAFNRKLQRDSRAFDLIYRTSPRRWVILWDANVAQARARMEQLAAAELDTASPLRLSWSAIGTLPIKDDQTASVLADRLARETLSDSESNGFCVEESISGGEPLLASSTTASDRLGAQLRHLAARVSAQNELLQQQAQSLRQRR